jgi:hypothetical protein
MRAGFALLVIASIIALSVATQANAAPLQSISLEQKQQEPFSRRLMKVLGFNEAGAADSANAADVKKPDAAPLPTAAEQKVPAAAAAGTTAPVAADSKPSELSKDATSTAPVQKEAVVTPGQMPSSSDSSKPDEQQKPSSAADSKPAVATEPVPAAKAEQPAAKVDVPPAKVDKPAAKVDKPAAAEPKPQDKPSAVPDQKPADAQPKPQEKPEAKEDKPAAQQPTAPQLPTAAQVPTAKPPQVKQVPSGGDSPFMMDFMPSGAKKHLAASVPSAVPVPSKRSGSGSDSPFMIDVLMPPKKKYSEDEYRKSSSHPEPDYDAQYDPKYDDEAYYPKVIMLGLGCVVGRGGGGCSKNTGCPCRSILTAGVRLGVVSLSQQAHGGPGILFA